MVLQKELLYALLGYTGQVIVDSPDGFSLAKGVPLIDASERALISRLLVLGHCYRELEEFVNTQLFYGCESGDFPSPYFLALALGLDELKGGERVEGGEAEGHVCCFCRQNPPGIALNFHQVSSQTPELSIRKSFFLACLSGTETVCLCGTETLFPWETEILCLCGTETLSVRNRDLASVRNTETQNLRLWVAENDTHC